MSVTGERVEPTYRTSKARVPVGSAVLVTNESSVGSEIVVMIKRTGAHGEGTWSFPGGWVDPGETPEDAAMREAWEEVGITVERVEFLGYTTDAHDEGLHAITMWFRARPGDWRGNPRNTNPARITEVEWWPIAYLRHGDWPGNLFLPVRNGLRAGLV